MEVKNMRVNRSLKVSLIGLLLMFLVSLVVLMPARLGQVIALPEHITVGNWSGSIWQGRAGHIAMNNRQGQVLLEGRLDWDLQLGSLLQGKLCTLFYVEESGLAKSQAHSMAAQAQGQACWADGTVSLHDVSFALPAERMLYNADMSLSGLIQGRLHSLEWQLPANGVQQRIAVSGEGQWRDIDLTVPGMTALRQVDWPNIPFIISSPDPGSFQLQAEFGTGETVSDPVKDGWPVAALSVNLNVTMNGAYQTEILLLPDERIDQELDNWLAMLAEEGSGDFAGGYRYFIASP
ncbi:hypothetical protein GCM10011403_21600 [Pseudohongiella nitratireducens]|uniref:Type II secretion system protein N n=1 Tax=Pseudohongiella nitratireducens TaxID=1768907 RepID=A0A916QLZ2_9GAMM|nr:type II secretion system protein N [Pseudohongiella nitratireducens]GFZ78268.1 hypothetical protein GCM10011403_21600 [Pseudohongiella nitratireducens]